MSDATPENGASKSCWVCDSTDISKTIKYNDWQVYKCQQCGFRFADDGPQLVLDQHYDESYFKPLQDRDTSEKWAAIYADRLDYLATHAPVKKLLEVGAGASTFALAAADVNFEVTVVDGAPWAVEFLTSHDGVSGWVADLNDFELPNEEFGAIHCSHVLEHLSNPRGFLAKCKDSLAPGGIMHLSFPAYEGRTLAIRDSVYRMGIANHPYNYQAPDHLSYFDAACIRATLERVGFEVVRLRRTKFISLKESLGRMGSRSPLRRAVIQISNLLGFITNRVGFHRDLEIIARRPSQAS